MGAVDDRRQTQNCSIGIIEHWIDCRIVDEWYKTPQLEIILEVMLHQ